MPLIASAGLPVLGSNIRTHTRYIANRNNGLIFEYSAQGFATAIKALCAEKDKLPEMKDQAFHAGQQYLWSRIEPDFLSGVARLVQA